jgi:uncharacterized repeat protein (TIGR03803 family)
MKSMRFILPLLAALAIMVTLTAPADAQTFTTLASFDGTDGALPYFGSVVQATNGNYYGSTWAGGYGYGVVFQVTPTGTLNDIYSFCAQSNCTDGLNPWSAPVLGADGNLYGTILNGGNGGAAGAGFGTVFKLTIAGKLTTLYSFCPGSVCTDGQSPVGLVQASNGNFYGTTESGGANNRGAIFEITPPGKFRTLYSFCSEVNCADGALPYSAPIQASNVNLYGTTGGGGVHGDGTVYEITPAGSGLCTASAPKATALTAPPRSVG